MAVALPANDLAAEGNKNVILTLGNPGGGATLGARSTATLKILDDEPTVQFVTATYSAAEGSAATLTLERTGPPASSSCSTPPATAPARPAWTTSPRPGP